MDDKRCKFLGPSGFNCGSYAFNLARDGIAQLDYCDVHYWQSRCEKAEVAALSQPAAQGAPDHSAGGECDRVPAHTPGPWTLIGKQGTAIWAGDEIIASCNGARSFHKIARANAQMMAAAPDLLEALQFIRKHGDTQADKAARMALSAIAKATP
jgi:hypothetical protein